MHYPNNRVSFVYSKFANFFQWLYSEGTENNEANLKMKSVKIEDLDEDLKTQNNIANLKIEC